MVHLAENSDQVSLEIMNDHPLHCEEIDGFHTRLPSWIAFRLQTSDRDCLS